MVGFKRGREVTVRDLIRESEPVRVDEQAGSETLGLWDCVFARVVRVGRTTCFTGAVLHFPRELAQRCLERLGGIARDLRKEIRKAAKKLGEGREASEVEARDFLLQSPKAGVFIFRRPIFETSDLAEESDVPRATARRILRVLRDQAMLEELAPPQGSRPAVLCFRELIETVERPSEFGEDPD